MDYIATPGDTVRVPNIGKALVIRRASATHIVVRLENGELILAEQSKLERVNAEAVTLTVTGVEVTEP